MKTRTHVLSTVAVGLGAALVVSGPARAAEPVQISGTAILTGVEFHQIQIPNDADHVVFVAKSIGSVTMPGLLTMMDRPTVVGEIAHGMGHYKSFLSSTDTNGTLSGIAEGKFQVVMVDGKPTTPGEGTWEWTNGTGRYANVRGKGTFTIGPGPQAGTEVAKITGTATGFDR
jgi:hypothetical protein